MVCGAVVFGRLPGLDEVRGWGSQYRMSVLIKKRHQRTVSVSVHLSVSLFLSGHKEEVMEPHTKMQLPTNQEGGPQNKTNLAGTLTVNF